MNFEQPRASEEMDVVKSMNPEGEEVVINVEEALERQKAYYDKLGLVYDWHRIDITDEMRNKIKQGIESGFTELLFIPSPDGTEVFIGKRLEEE